ncbi:MAG: pyridoxal phosphate-dependent aminotransferase [Nitrospirota bacterium]|nr:pyridoxal phosphate-dependent aminotransferase [Nitrospirota bacterium]
MSDVSSESPLAGRLKKIKPSPTLRITAEAARLKSEGVDIVSLAAGEPDFGVPEHVQEAAIASIRDGKSRYTPSAGIPELRKAIAQKLRTDNGLDYTPDEITVGCGAKNILFTLAQVLFDPKDEIVIPAPYWVTYPDQAFLNDARPLMIRTREADGFTVHPDVLRKAVGRKTKAIILNNPCNPTGAGYTREQLEQIAEIALECGAWIISDEIYEKIVYDDFEFVATASLSPQVKARTITVNGLSKSHAMTGWRMGYAAGPAEIIKAMTMVQSQNISNVTSTVQWASVAALTGDQSCLKEMVAAFQQRKDYVVQRLNGMEGIWCFEPKGAFYAFPRIAHYFAMVDADGNEYKDSTSLCEYLLKQALVSVIPGAAFGGDEYLRLSFATSMDQLKEGLDRIEQALSRLKPGPHYDNYQAHLEQKRF